MAKNPSHRRKSPARFERARCESVHFAEVEFRSSVVPRLVIQFSEGLSILVENESAISLAAEFIVAFRANEKGVRK